MATVNTDQWTKIDDNKLLNKRFELSIKYLQNKIRNIRISLTMNEKNILKIGQTNYNKKGTICL